MIFLPYRFVYIYSILKCHISEITSFCVYSSVLDLRPSVLEFSVRDSCKYLLTYKHNNGTMFNRDWKICYSFWIFLFVTYYLRVIENDSKSVSKELFQSQHYCYSCVICKCRNIIWPKYVPPFLYIGWLVIYIGFSFQNKLFCVGTYYFYFYHNKIIY